MNLGTLIVKQTAIENNMTVRQLHPLETDIYHAKHLLFFRILLLYISSHLLNITNFIQQNVLNGKLAFS